MSYRPREFWDRRLAEHFDLRGTGQPGLSAAYNQACYALRREVLQRALSAERFDPRGKQVLDVGCGTGFFTAFYLDHGAQVTGIDIAPTSIERLRARHPEARFELVDVSEASLDRRYDLVNAFDVLYHITDEARWERAVRTLADAVSPRGLLLLTDTFPDPARSPPKPLTTACGHWVATAPCSRQPDSGSRRRARRMCSSTASLEPGGSSTALRACCSPSTACCSASRSGATIPW